jgi:hypothetical protein
MGSGRSSENYDIALNGGQRFLLPTIKFSLVLYFLVLQVITIVLSLVFIDVPLTLALYLLALPEIADVAVSSEFLSIMSYPASLQISPAAE